MENETVAEEQGIKIVQQCGGFVELYFDWNLLPHLDLSKHYYSVEMIPDVQRLPPEYARPNSAGPLHFHLAESVTYQINLLRVEHLLYTVDSGLKELPWVDLITQHENLQQLAWGHIDFPSLTAGRSEPMLEILVDGGFYKKQSVYGEPSSEIKGRPRQIRLMLEDGNELFTVQTNLAEREVVRSLSLKVEKQPTKLTLSTVINPAGGWRIRAELNHTFDIRTLWQRFFSKRFPNTDLAKVIGNFRLYDNDKVVQTVRQFGFWTRVRVNLIDQIQLEEWKLKQRMLVREVKLQLQITSAHRELYRYVLLEKVYPLTTDLTLVGLSEQEIGQAETNLAAVNNRVSWDQAHLELVLWFRMDDERWHEFQRETAHNLRWDFIALPGWQRCRCEWILSHAENNNQCLVVLRSGWENRPQWPAKVLLQPFCSNRLVALWDLNQQNTEQIVRSQWKADLNQVGFFLKVHEEYLGKRMHRPDLDVHIPELFTAHQNLYFQVEPDRCYSAEIVARHYHSEIALTPVSRAIVTPREQSAGGMCSSFRRPSDRWHHPTQREVRQLAGRDSSNKAKVMMHLHCHSPNLFRADPFRETYLKDVTWPIKTVQGAEVHNPPGEWVAKNCMDAWLPLLRMLRKLAFEQVDYQLSLDISPPVAYVLSSPRFKDYMSRYLLRVQAFVQARLAMIKNRNDSPAYVHAAARYLGDLRALDLFYNQELGKDIIGAFSDLERRGFLEISTCTATHGMPAEMANMPDLLKSQITLAVTSHQRLFGTRPPGIWLAENSYFPGVEGFLAGESLHYFFVESEAVLLASATPQGEEFNPVMIPGSDLTAFPRSRLGRTQVWDAELGYAGHPDFREYHFRHLGLPIKKITSKKSNDKHAYDPDRAEETARRLAWDFHHKLSEKAHQLSQQHFPTIPLITCSYDAELFGHHWSEGPIFLEELLREFHRKNDAIGFTTPSHYLIDSVALPEVVPNPSTWGHEAVHVRWSDPKVIWVYRELERAEGVLNRYLGLALERKLAPWQIDMVEQMAAELIRPQSSDLTFVIMSGDFEEDMRREILKYFDYFYKLKHLIDNGIEAREFVSFRKYENDMFPEIPSFYNVR